MNNKFSYASLTTQTSVDGECDFILVAFLGARVLNFLAYLS